MSNVKFGALCNGSNCKPNPIFTLSDGGGCITEYVKNGSLKILVPVNIRT